MDKKETSLDKILKEKQATKFLTGVEDYEGRRAVNASKSVNLRDYVTREELIALCDELRAQGLTITTF